MPKLLAALAALVAAAALAACGAPQELSQEEGTELALARERVEDAVDTEETLRTSPDEARRLHAKVRKIVSTGSLEAQKLDEFGLAALGELRMAVPSLVPVDRRDNLRELDRVALRTFLEHALQDAPRALHPAAEAGLASAGEVLDETGAGPDTDIPVVRQTASAYLDDLERILRPIWPDLADEAAQARKGL